MTPGQPEHRIGRTACYLQREIRAARIEVRSGDSFFRKPYQAISRKKSIYYTMDTSRVDAEVRQSVRLSETDLT